MATTAKQTTSTVRGSSPASGRATSPALKKTTSSSSSSSSLIEVRNSSIGGGNTGEEDIETIAKQISDHAEAIYQTWKARGLAPTEILNCHSVTSDAFGRALTPVSPRNRSQSPAANEILSQSPTMSNNNLKKLVSSFVSEDKARQQQQTSTARETSPSASHVAARKTNILTSGTIRDALRKFECVDTNQTNVKPNFVRSNSNSKVSSSSTIVVRQQSPQPVPASASSVTHATTITSQVLIQQSPSPSPQLPQPKTSSVGGGSTPHANHYANQLNKNVPDVLINTIEREVKLSAAAVSANVVDTNSTAAPVRVKPETPAKPASLLNHQPAWPLKNRIERTVVENGSVTSTTTVVTPKASQPSSNGHSSHTNRNSNSVRVGGHDSVKNTTVKKADNKLKSTNLMDEVLMEEERLINALKTGTVLNNVSVSGGGDTALPEVITSHTVTSSSAPWSNDRDDALVKPSTINSSSSNISKNNFSNNLPINNSNSNSSNISDAVDGGQMKFAAKPRHKNDAAVPHPEVNTNSAKINGIANPRQVSTVPAVRPFLTRGSVAERVLMFEKCPEAKALRNVPKEPNKLQVSAVNTYF